MTNISEHKMMSHIDRIMGEHKPITADIFLTNHCNNSCPYCTYKRWDLKTGTKAMTYQEFVEYATIMDNLGVKGYILTGGGEPMLAPEFDRIAGWLTETGKRWGINTNFNRFSYIKPDYLKVSLDGWDEESYQAARGVRMYKKVRENITRYVEWKKEHSPKTAVGIQMVAESVEAVEQFYEGNQDLDIDYMVFRPVESTGGGYYRNKKKELSGILNLIGDLTRFDHRVVRNFKWDLLEVQGRSCEAQWAQIAVNEYGEVMYCCHKPYQIVGHITDPDIMNRKEWADTNMRQCDIPCRMTAPNMFVSELLRDREDDCFI